MKEFYEKRYKSLFENTNDAILILDMSKNIIDVNEKACKLYGYSKSELLSMNFLDITVSSKPYNKAQISFNEIGKKCKGLFEAYHITKSRKKIPVELSACVAEYENQKVIQVFIRDRTEIKELESLNNKLLKDLKIQKENLKLLSKGTIKVLEEERQRISRELHDEIGQAFIAINLNLELIDKRIDPLDEKGKLIIKDTMKLLREVMESTQRISYNLRPTMLDDLGLIPTLRWYTNSFSKRNNIKVILEADSNVEGINNEIKLLIYRIVQESLTNVFKHSEADEVNIILKSYSKQLELKIIDNGKGFDQKEVKDKGLGLLGIKERIKLVGGEYYIDSSIGEGTKINVIIPRRHHEIKE